MNFDTALEMALISSWDDLMKADDHSSLHVEYDSSPDTAVESVQVWSVGPHGHADRVCNYSIALPPEVGRTQFVNSYHSELLGKMLAVVLHHQDQFARRPHQCANGLVQVGPPSMADRERAAIWRHDIGIDAVRTGSIPFAAQD